MFIQQQCFARFEIARQSRVIVPKAFTSTDQHQGGATFQLEA